jgi:hypothetical protein
MSLPGLEARVENGSLVIETARESQYCGRELLYAKAFHKWIVSTQEVPQVPAAQADRGRKTG